MPTGYIVPPPPYVSPKAAVAAHGTSATLTAADQGKNHTNTGAGSGIILTLPAASNMAGCAFRVQLTLALPMTLTPAAGQKIFLGGDGVPSKSLLITGAIGTCAEIYCDGVDYLVTGYTGPVSKEP